MPTETVLVLALTIAVFGGFALALWGVDRYSRDARRTNNPLPGE